MKADCFIDTNILVYAVSNNEKEQAKKIVAFDLLEQNICAVSTVVLGEFYTVVTKKAKRGFTHSEAMAWVDTLLEFPCAIIEPEDVVKAMDLSSRKMLSYYDSTHIIAAKKLFISTVYSEDMGHDVNYDGVRVINPFLTPTI